MFCTAWNVLGPTAQPKSVTRKVFEEEKLLISSFSEIASLISSLPASIAFLYKKGQASGYFCMNLMMQHKQRRFQAKP